jgi:hypothetical protein
MDPEQTTPVSAAPSLSRRAFGVRITVAATLLLALIGMLIFLVAPGARRFEWAGPEAIDRATRKTPVMRVEEISSSGRSLGRGCNVMSIVVR